MLRFDWVFKLAISEVQSRHEDLFDVAYFKFNRRLFAVCPGIRACLAKDDPNRASPVKLSDFEGRWVIKRHIFDLDSQWLGRFHGEATMTPSNMGLLYHEEGELQFGGLTAMKATRDYIWREPEPGIFRVLFADGKHFHDFPSNEGRPKATHYCDPDEYDVTYDFRKWPDWRAEWRVEGPRKDYRMVSIYSRP